MKNTLKTLLIASALTLPMAAYAGHDGHGKKQHDHEAHQCMQGEDCPMHDGMKHPGKDNSHHQKHMDKEHDHKEGMHGGGHGHDHDGKKGKAHKDKEDGHGGHDH